MLNPRQFVRKMGAKRSAVKGLNIAAGRNASNNAWHNASGTTEHQSRDPFSVQGPFSLPSSAERLSSAANAARSAGVSERKINKVTTKASNIGASHGTQDAAFGAGKPNPFTSNQRYNF